ncbi:MAG TPA: HipA domain-containing protein [Candidatus Competibacter sp.]|nr:HipA domain-containing protein [Candidatus Competibacter sp.]HRX62880.1 HipA domain-containing protein [Candidatus Competibacter sp.]
MTRSSEEQFCVYLYDRLIGRLHRRDDVTRFVFEEGYWDDPNRPVLGLRFEDNPRERHRSHLRLPPWFSNLLPEGRLREWIAQARRTSTEREMELLAQVGHDLPGAVRVLAADEMVPVDLGDGGDANGRQRSSMDSLWSFSLAGVGLKFSMRARGDRLVIPARGERGDWIAKLPDPTYPGVPQNELAMMTLAKAVDIDVPEIQLVHRDDVESLPERVWSGQDHLFAVKRFDRGPGRELIHIEDMAQVRGFYPDAKYRGGFETVGALVYRGHDIEALREFARRLAFNLLIGNGDAHLKNWSLIYRDPRVPTLAPAYDLVATFIYRPSVEGPEEMALHFGRSKRFEDARISTFSRLDETLGAKADLGDVVRTLVDRVIVEWPRAAALLQGYPAFGQEIELFIQKRARQLVG